MPSDTTLANATVALAVLTALLVVAGLVQAWYMSRHARHLEALTVVAKQTAAAAKLSADAAQAAIARSQRAHLAVHPKSVEREERHPDPSIRLEIANDGKSRAQITAASISIKWSDEAFPAPELQEVEPLNDALIAADAHISRSHTVVAPEGWSPSTVRPTWLFVFVEYSDAYGGSYSLAQTWHCGLAHGAQRFQHVPTPEWDHDDERLRGPVADEATALPGSWLSRLWQRIFGR